MNPAFSVIFFTSASGAGYGVWFLLGLGLLWNAASMSKVQSLFMLTVGFLFVSAGLLSSLLHLGHPERAWRALSQWRSSWLSREGVASLLCFIPAAALGVCILKGNCLFFTRLFGAWLALNAMATVYCTARIYTSLKTIPAWRHALVLPGYLLLGLMNGALWSWTIATGFGQSLPAATIGLLALIAFAWCGKWFYWRFLAQGNSNTTIGSATGLGRFGRVKSFEQPHTEENYLLKEMGFALGRKHATRLRRATVILAFVIPATLVITASATPTFRLAWALLAALSASLGVMVERWLFFAQARHVVTLYYGAESV